MDSLWAIARQTFAPNSPGAALWALMFVAVVGFLLSYIATAVGKGQISRMIEVSTMFTAVIMVANVVVKAIIAVAGVAGFR
jgi:hypothetical protein